MAIDLIGKRRPRGPMDPPRAKRHPAFDRHHGIERRDDYAWLRADNWQEVMRDPDVLDPEIRKYLEAENAYMEAMLEDTEALQDTLFTEMKGRIKEDDSSVPAPHGPFAYYLSYVTGAQHPRFCRQPRKGGGEDILIDGNILAEPHAYFRFGGVSHSPDHKRLAYASDTNGSEYFRIAIFDIDSPDTLLSEVPDTSGSFVWSGDAETLFYTRLDDNHRPREVYRHRIGTSAEADVLVYREDDPGFFVGVGLTQDERYIVINAHDHQTLEAHLIDAREPEMSPRRVLERESGHEYSIEHRDGELIILTNDAGAEDFKIVAAPLASPGRDSWREIEPHRPGRLILDATPFKEHLVRLEREHGLPRIVIRRFADDDEHEIAFEEEAYSLGMSAGYEFDTRQLRFTYSSMTTPGQVFDYDMEDRTRVLRKTQEVPSGHNPRDYVTRRIEAPAEDGETVPVSLLYHKDTPLDGTAPALIYGYGAYGYALPAAFSTNCLSLVDRGFLYALAHIRGGKDKGYGWYRQGRGAHKANSFKDFIAAGRHLAAKGFTREGAVIAQGGSAGGMLMGAVANMAPELFGGIIAEVPFVDVLTTMLDDTLPLTPPEWPEWGNPIESREAYETIAAYSPYDNVTAQAYPHILAVGGLTDPRVTYWEPAKWIAKLRELKTDDNLTLLKTNMEAGHGGASGRFDRLKEVALVYAFAIMISEPPNA